MVNILLKVYAPEKYQRWHFLIHSMEPINLTHHCWVQYETVCVHQWFEKCFSHLSLCPQLLPKQADQNPDERKLHKITCVCADILLGQPECDLPALPGSHLCADWARYLCYCECIGFERQFSVSLRWRKISSLFGFLCFCAGLSAKNCSVCEHSRYRLWFFWTSTEIRWEWVFIRRTAMFCCINNRFTCVVKVTVMLLHLLLASIKSRKAVILFSIHSKVKHLLIISLNSC